jgi:prefoldin subunit 5
MQYNEDLINKQNQVEEILEEVQACKTQLDTLRKKKKENGQCLAETLKQKDQKKFWVYTASSFMVQMNREQMETTITHDENNIEKEIQQLRAQIDKLVHNLKVIDPHDQFRVQKMLLAE